MQVNDKRHEIPVEQIMEAVQQIDTPEDTKIKKRPLGRPRKRTKFNFSNKHGPPLLRNLQLPPAELWTPNRLRQTGREKTLNRLKEIASDQNLFVNERRKERSVIRWRRRREIKELQVAAAAEAIYFVNIKDEQQIVDVKSEQDANLHPEIEEHEKSANRWSVRVKDGRHVVDTGDEREPETGKETSIQVDCGMATRPCNKTKTFRKEPRFRTLWEKKNQRIDGIDANASNSKGPLTSQNKSKVFGGHVSETAIAPDTKLTSFDVLCNVILYKSEKPNSHHSQQHNQLQRFVRLCTSRPSDYILSTVAWHKLNGRNDDGIDESFI